MLLAQAAHTWMGISAKTAFKIAWHARIGLHAISAAEKLNLI